MTDRAPRPRPLAPSASPDEAAAIAAALETFMRATAPAAQEPAEQLDPWHRAAILEGVSREPEADIQHPWINT
jgi:hypothetical protein